MRLALNKHIAYRIMDLEAVMINTKSSDIVVLNEVGSAIIKLLEDKNDSDVIPEILQKDYSFDGPIDEIKNDVSSFLTELKEKGILEESTT